jgi:heat-inducible transcriptional repressor
MALSERRARILTLIVDDFVGSAQPVGSQALVERHKLPLSSATVRNEMAALEDEGMITHPHTSAGRIPSHRGYRYYVSSLMPERPLTPQDQFTILHQFHQASRDLEEWVGLAASVLANNLHNMALVTQPRVPEVRLKQLQLVELAETRALLVIVTSDGGVHQRILDFPVAASQEFLSRLALRINTELGGRTVAELPKGETIEPPGAVEAAVLAALGEILLREQAARIEEPIVEGVRALLRQPEFERADRLLDALDAVDERRLRDAIPAEAVANANVAIVIGDENREGPYQEMSFVLARYGPPRGAAGIVGLLGPTRMNYPDAVAHVRYVSDVLTELIREFYGGDQ